LRNRIKANLFDSLTPEGYREHTEEKMDWVHKQPKFDGPAVFTDKDLLSPWVDQVESTKKIAWILECREIHPFAYQHILAMEHKFDHIFTFDEELLERSDRYVKNLIASSRVSHADAGLHEKSKLASLIASNKNWARGHKLRHIVAKNVQGRYDVELWGSGYRPWGNPNIPSAAAQQEGKNEPLQDYFFSITIMNSKQNNYFTETLVDVFRHGTIPIFWGCDNVGDYFNTDGILTFNTGPELFKILDNLSPDLYYERYDAVKENFETAKKYMSMHDTFADNLGRILSDDQEVPTDTVGVD
tara:strand:+ start:886 stop:1785 length:900 start_codon:yes stop_codon:yes gene_type:complete